MIEGETGLWYAVLLILKTFHSEDFIGTLNPLVAQALTYNAALIFLLYDILSSQNSDGNRFYLGRSIQQNLWKDDQFNSLSQGK